MHKLKNITKCLNPALYTGMISKEKFVKDKKGNKIFFLIDKNREHILDKNGQLIPVSRKEDGDTVWPLDYERIKFQNQENCKYLPATYSAGSVGVTFTAGKAVIRDDLPDFFVEQYRADDRCHQIDDDYRSHYDVKYFSLISKYSEKFLEETKKIWIQADRQYYVVVEDENDNKVSKLEVIEKDDLESFENITVITRYKEVTDYKIAKKENLQSAYEMFFAQGTYDQVQAKNLKRQSRVFYLINDGFADESLMEEGNESLRGLVD